MPIRRRTLLLSLLLCSLTMQSRADLNDESFVMGWKIGQVDMHEAKILDAFVAIQFVEGENGNIVARFVSAKKQQINLDLLSLAKYSEEIDRSTPWPDEVQAVILVKSSNLQATMHRLREARRVDKWEDSDSENEAAIQRVFEEYEHFGNLLGIEDEALADIAFIGTYSLITESDCYAEIEFFVNGQGEFREICSGEGTSPERSIVKTKFVWKHGAGRIIVSFQDSKEIFEYHVELSCSAFGYSGKSPGVVSDENNYFKVPLDCD